MESSRPMTSTSDITLDVGLTTPPAVDEGDISIRTSLALFTDVPPVCVTTTACMLVVASSDHIE